MENKMGICQHKGFRFTQEAERLPRRFDLGLPEVNEGGIGLAVGIGVRWDAPEDKAWMIARLSGGYNVHIVHEPARGWIPDLAKAGLHLIGMTPKAPVQEVRKIWDAFFARSKEGRFLQFCHSKGTLYVKLALEGLPAHLRERIEVVSLAGATYIPESLCSRAIHYISERDFVPLLDVRNKRVCAARIEILKPDLRAPFFDHTIYSPTYRPLIQRHLSHYLSRT